MTTERATGVPGVYSNPNGTFTVKFHVKGENYHCGTYKSIGEARAVCKKKRAELGIKERISARVHQIQKVNPDDPGYVPIIPFEQQCERCSRPHLPGSRYCEHHSERTGNYLKAKLYKGK